MTRQDDRNTGTRTPRNPSPIVEVIEIVPGTTVTVTYEYLPARDIPPRGSVWPVDIDYPGVCVTLALVGTHVPEYLIDSNVCVFGESLSFQWGNRSATTVSRSISRFAETLNASHAECVEEVTRAVAALRRIVDARNVRVAQRNATVARAKASSPWRHED